MSVQKQQKPDSEKNRSTNLSFQIIAIIVIIMVAVLFFLWHQKSLTTFSANNNLQPSQNQTISVPDTPGSELKRDGGSTNVGKLSQNMNPLLPTNTDGAGTGLKLDEQPEPPDPVTSANNGTKTQPSQVQDRTSSENAQTANGSEQSLPTDPLPFSHICAQSAQTIKRFYAHLDSQEYIQQFQLTPDSETHFSRLIQRLLENPPVVSGETNDLFTILQNTAHFFRIIGKENIIIIKAILDREKNQFENVLAEFYTLLNIPLCPQKSFNLNISESSLYDYAGFFLNTMGGRLYLFRRDSMSRMVVSYYAILLIDQANRNSSNKHGIELKTAIDQLIAEMETTANTLLLKDTYLDKLYSLKEQYQ